MTTPTHNGRATPAQLARVYDLAEITGVTVQWLGRWYRYGFGRPLDQMDAATARALITYLPYWPVRLRLTSADGPHDASTKR